MTEADSTIGSPRCRSKPLTVDRATLFKLIRYNPETGDFTWRPRPLEFFTARQHWSAWNARHAGMTAGHTRAPKKGKQYITIKVCEGRALAHRLAWFYMTGEWPPHGVDHRDGNGLNNRWGNLRLATQSQNNANAKRPCTNTTGFKGVSLEKRTGRFAARIHIDKETISLGTYDTPEEAHAAYMEEAVRRFGEFARAE